MILLNEETGKRYTFKEVGEYITLPVKPKNKIALVIGHHILAKGAKSEILNRTEYDFFFEEKRILNSYGFDVFSHNPNTRGYTNRQRETAELTQNYDLAIELHFNMGRGSGCSAMHHKKNLKTESISTDLCSGISTKMGIPSVGRTPITGRTLNGSGFIMEQKTDAILLECFFGDNEYNCKNWNFLEFIEILNNLDLVGKGGFK